jgi:hypothetical protein
MRKRFLSSNTCVLWLKFALEAIKLVREWYVLAIN